MRTIPDLMMPVPEQWGLRGDPALWDMLAGRFRQTPLPEDGTSLRLAIEVAFLNLAGAPIADAPAQLFVAATDRDNGGMSRGHVSGIFWRDTVLPLLLARFTAARGPFILPEIAAPEV